MAPPKPPSEPFRCIRALSALGGFAIVAVMFTHWSAFTQHPANEKKNTGQVTYFRVVGPFDGAIDARHGPEHDADSRARYDPRTGMPTAAREALPLQVRKTDSDGVLDLASTFPAPKTSVYALTFVHSPTDQAATLEIAGSAVARYWLNDKKILDFAPCCGAEPFQVPLRAGWNKVLVRIFSTSGELGISLRIRGNGLQFSHQAGHSVEGK